MMLSNKNRYFIQQLNWKREPFNCFGKLLSGLNKKELFHHDIRVLAHNVQGFPFFLSTASRNIYSWEKRLSFWGIKIKSEVPHNFVFWSWWITKRNFHFFVFWVNKIFYSKFVEKAIFPINLLIKNSFISYFSPKLSVITVHDVLGIFKGIFKFISKSILEKSSGKPGIEIKDSAPQIFPHVYRVELVWPFSIGFLDRFPWQQEHIDEKIIVYLNFLLSYCGNDTDNFQIWVNM